MTRTMEKIAPALLIVSVFVIWELFCLMAGISELVLPRPTQIVAALVKYAPAIWPHAWQTFYTTMVGFAFGVACPGGHADPLQLASERALAPRRLLLLDP